MSLVPAVEPPDTTRPHPQPATVNADHGPMFPADLRPEWHNQAACRNADPALFYPGRGESTQEARLICSGCPVREQCLDYALEYGSWADFGVWGGTSERQRRAIRRQRNNGTQDRVAS